MANVSKVAKFKVTDLNLTHASTVMLSIQIAKFKFFQYTKWEPFHQI